MHVQTALRFDNSPLITTETTLTDIVASPVVLGPDDPKEGKFFSLSLYKNKKRLKADFQNAVILGIDIDKKQHGCAERILGSNHGITCQHAVHESASSTPEARAVHLLFDLTPDSNNPEPVDEAEYRLLEAFVISRFNLDVDPNCEGPFRILFWPATRHIDHYLYRTVAQGPTLRAFASRNRTGNSAASTIPPEYIESPTERLTETTEQLKSMLSAIPDDDENTGEATYKKWISYGHAIHYQFKGSPEGEDMFVEFSRDRKGWTDEDACRSRYKKFNYNRPGAIITFATIKQDAIKAGWKDDWSIYNIIKAEMEAATTKEALIEIANKANTLNLDISRCDLLRDELKQRVRAVSKTILSAAALKTFFVPPAAQISSITPKMTEMVKGWCLDLTTVKFCNIKDPALEYSAYQFNELYDDSQLSRSAVIQGIRPKIPISRLFRSVLSIQQTYGTVYTPGAGPITDDHKRNTWRAPVFDPNPYHNPAVSTAITDHVHALAGEQAQTLLDFLSFTVQNPGVKIRWSPLIYSIQGAGKGLVETLMKLALGIAHVGIPRQHDVSNNFNRSWAEGYQLVFISEVKAGGKNRSEFTDALKTYISDNDVMIEGKGINGYPIINVTNYVLETNNAASVNLPSTERRYSVIRSPIQTAADITKTKPMRDKITAIIDAGNKAPEIRYFFENYPVSKSFDPNGHAPHTFARDSLFELNKSQTSILIEEILTETDPNWVVGISDETAEPPNYPHLINLSSLANRIEMLSEAGDCNYSIIRDPQRLSGILADEFQYRAFDRIKMSTRGHTCLIHHDAPRRISEKDIRYKANGRELLHKHWKQVGEKVAGTPKP